LILAFLSAASFLKSILQKIFNFVKKISMAFLKLGNFSIGFGSGKDAFTTSPVLNFNKLLGVKTPNWISTDGKEIHYYKTTDELYTVIATKANMISNGVFKHYRVVNGREEELTDTDVLHLLNNPNPLQSRTEWLTEELIQTSLFGNSIGYGLKGFSGQQLPNALWNLPVQDIQVIPEGGRFKQSNIDGIIKKYDLITGGKVVDSFTPSEVFHSRVYNPDNPIIGMSPLIPLMMPLSNIRGAYGYRNVLINERGAVGIISSGNKDEGDGVPMDATTREKLEKQYGANYGIRDAQSPVIISESNLSWQPMTYPTKDLMLFEEINEDFNRIIDAYGLNQYLFSKEKGATFTNVTEGKRMAYQDAIIPYANNRAEKLTKFLGLEERGEWVELDYTHIEALQSNAKDEAETIKLKADAYETLNATENFTTEQLNDIIGL
jgi:HK97 family phage portal protein